MSWDVFNSCTGSQWWLNWSKCHVKMLACCSLLQMGGSKKVRMCCLWEKWSSAEAKLLAADLTPSMCVLDCPLADVAVTAGTFWQDVGGGGKPRPPTTPLRKFFIILQICKFVRFNRSFTSASVLRVFFFFFRLRIQEGCQDTQKVRLPEVYRFCNIFKQTVRAMRS